jgi:hypothetical protein
VFTLSSDKNWRNTYILVRKPNVNRPLTRAARRWEENIKMDVEYSGYEEDMIRFMWLRVRTSGGALVNTVMHLYIKRQGVS